MKKILFLIIFLFLCFGVVGKKLSSITREDVCTIRKTYLLDTGLFLVNAFREDNKVEIFKDLLWGASFFWQEKNLPFLDEVFSDESWKDGKVIPRLQQYIFEVPERSLCIFIDYLICQINLFSDIFLENKENYFVENLKKDYLRGQEIILGYLIKRYYGEQFSERFFCSHGDLNGNYKNWLKMCECHFYIAGARFRAAFIREYLEIKYPGLKFISDLMGGADVGGRFISTCNFSRYHSLGDWVQSKGLAPENLSFENLLQMLKAEPDVFESQLNHFKIHLMPKDGDLLRAMETFIDAFLNDEESKCYISGFKIKALFEEKTPGVDYPKIVIYVEGWEGLNVVLEKVCNVFKGWTGLERAPAFNEKVGRIIYFAQGDRYDKKFWPELYLAPQRAYFDFNVAGIIRGERGRKRLSTTESLQTMVELQEDLGVRRGDKRIRMDYLLCKS